MESLPTHDGREHGVDETLHSMVNAEINNKQIQPGVLVLATGDGNKRAGWGFIRAGAVWGFFLLPSLCLLNVKECARVRACA